MNFFSILTFFILGPPETSETLNSEEITDEVIGFKAPCSMKSKEALSAIQRATTQDCKYLIANISCEVSIFNLFFIVYRFKLWQVLYF